MTTAALVMAGGRGARMAVSHGGQRKPLVAVRFVPLLERNLLALFGRGIDEVTVAVPAAQPEISAFVGRRGQELAGVLGCKLEVLVEETPRGTIGCAADFADQCDELLVVNADNLTNLDLRAMLEHHRQDDAAMCVATHRQTWRSRLGEVEVTGGRLVDYHEKPEHSTRISSGIYVLGRGALDALTGDPTSAPELVRRLLRAGLEVSAYEHCAAWIDVNDADAAKRAETLIARHSDTFECWHSSPYVEVAGVILHGEHGVLLEHRAVAARLYPDQWDTPGGKLEPGERPEDAARREIAEELALQLGRLDRVLTFDDVDPASRRVVRHHVFAAAISSDPKTTAKVPLRWISRFELPATDAVNPVALRSLAAWRSMV